MPSVPGRPSPATRRSLASTWRAWLCACTCCSSACCSCLRACTSSLVRPLSAAHDRLQRLHQAAHLAHVLAVDHRLHAKAAALEGQRGGGQRDLLLRRQHAQPRGFGLLAAPAHQPLAAAAVVERLAQVDAGARLQAVGIAALAAAQRRADGAAQKGLRLAAGTRFFHVLQRGLGQQPGCADAVAARQGIGHQLLQGHARQHRCGCSSCTGRPRRCHRWQRFQFFLVQTIGQHRAGGQRGGQHGSGPRGNTPRRAAGRRKSWRDGRADHGRARRHQLAGK